MAFCHACGLDLDAEDRFCRRCGAQLRGMETVEREARAAMERPAASEGPSPPAPSRAGSARRSVLVAAIVFAILPIGGIFLFSRGCSSVEGTLVAHGPPLGDWTLVPASCKSGDRRKFFGVVVLPEAFNQGGLKVVRDEVRNAWAVSLELPGSCASEDDECTVITVDPAHCTLWDIALAYTNTTVNDVRLIDGRINLACTFPEGGELKAALTLESCD